MVYRVISLFICDCYYISMQHKLKVTLFTILSPGCL